MCFEAGFFVILYVNARITFLYVRMYEWTQFVRVLCVFVCLSYLTLTHLSLSRLESSMPGGWLVISFWILTDMALHIECAVLRTCTCALNSGSLVPYL